MKNSYTSKIQAFSAKILQDQAFSSKILQDQAFSSKILQDQAFSAKILQDQAFSSKIFQDSDISCNLLQDQPFSSFRDQAFSSKIFQDSDISFKLLQDQTISSKIPARIIQCLARSWKRNLTDCCSKCMEVDVNWGVVHVDTQLWSVHSLVRQDDVDSELDVSQLADRGRPAHDGRGQLVSPSHEQKLHQVLDQSSRQMHLTQILLQVFLPEKY